MSKKTDLTIEEQVEALRLKAEELTLKLEALEELVAAQENTIKSLSKNNGSVSFNKTAKSIKTPTETFTVQGNEYKFILPAFRINGTKVIAEDALNDEKLLEIIVSKYPDNVERV